MGDVKTRVVQVDGLKVRLKEGIQRYAEVEREGRAKNRGRMERQIRIVNPGLQENEVVEMVRQAEVTGGQGLFSQAVRLLFPPYLRRVLRT